jgi:hypothetical protein
MQLLSNDEQSHTIDDNDMQLIVNHSQTALMNQKLSTTVRSSPLDVITEEPNEENIDESIEIDHMNK